MSGPEHNPRDDEQPTKEEWEAFEARRRAEVAIETLALWDGFSRWWETMENHNRQAAIDRLTEALNV